MKSIYYVQTGTFKIPEEIDGFDSIVDLNYMGAAEFEQCIVREDGKYVTKNPLYLSLKRILKNRNDYAFSKIVKRKNTKGEPMYVFCKKEETVDTISGIRELIKKDYTCKRGIHLTSYFERTLEELENPNLTNFWWDIENDFFFFFGDEKKNMLTIAMDHLYQEWKDEFEGKKKVSFFKKLSKIFSK